MTIKGAPAKASLKLNLRLCLLVTLLASLLSLETKAEDGLVEIRVPDAQPEAYREERRGHSWMFGLGVENYLPTNFASAIDGTAYGDMFGNSSVPIAAIDFGYKSNFSFGSIGLLAGYGTGQVGSAMSGENRTLSIVKTAVRLQLALDTLFEEPYVVPYLAAGLYRFGIDEAATDAGLTFSGQTEFGTETTAGLLLQLNWLDEDSSRESRQSAGLQNTFLNIFVSQFGATQSSNDPETTSGWNLGAGLVLEF